MTVSPDPATRGSAARRWWITTGRKQDNGSRVLGPFDTRDLALEVRTLAERAWNRDGAFWVVTGHEIPERSITPGFFDRAASRGSVARGRHA